MLLFAKKDFLSLSGWLFLSFIFSLPAAADNMPEKDITGKAGARIEKHRKGDAALKLVGPDGKPLAPGLKVQVEQTRHAFLFGCNIFKFDRCRTPEQNAEYKKRFREVFNFATLGFYWNSYEKEQGKPDVGRWKPVAEWCKENGIRTKGHPLVWTYEPRWLHGKTGAEAEKLLWDRVTREIKTYRGLIDMWDVLNEPGVGQKQAADRKAVATLYLYEKHGPVPVIQQAFAHARKANPKATLILNDFDTSKKYENITQASLDAKVPIDVLGIQSHMHGGAWSPARTWSVCERFARFGKPLHFTEVTIISGPPKKWQPGRIDGWNSTPEGEKRQAEEVAEFYKVLFSHPSVEAITWWDFTDQGAWRGAPAGFLDNDLAPKAAFHALKKLVKDDWWTRTETAVGQDGAVNFRGFFGQYKITVLSQGKRLAGAFTLEKQQNAPVEIRLK